MKKRLHGFLTLLLVLVVQIGFAQEKTVTGTVVDEDGLPLPGVSVFEKNTSNGTQTDFDGNYSLDLEPGDLLVFSYVGFKPQEITIGASDVYDITMAVDAAALDEVVITGQGSGIQKKRLSTTVDQISEEEIDRLPATQIDQILQSNAPSAQIRLSSGQPGTAAIIRTRGPISAASSATPVVIVDGIRVDNLNSNPSLGIGTGGANVSALADIPVESIEKIEYIKGGAATTLYGADAANGVIQIITKKGKGGKARITYENRVGVIKATDDYLKYDRTGEAIFEPGLSIEHNFGINGGSEKFTYNFGGSLYQDDSFNDLNEQVKRSFTFGLGAQVSDKLKYQGSFSYVGFESNLDFNANTSFSRFSAFEGGGRGNLDELTEEEWLVEKERAQNIGSLVDIQNTVNRLTASNKFTYDITDNFQSNVTFGVDYRNSKSEEVDSNALLIALGSIPEGTTDQASLTRVLRSSFTATGDINFTHNADLGNFSFVSILGGQFFRTADRQNRLDASGGVDGTRSVNNFSTITGSDFTLENANYGLYFLENIGIYDVAFLEFGGRIDKNTSAGEDTDALFLPKVGITYNISDHDFYTRSNFANVLNRIKLRANYGEATNFAQPFSQDRTFALESFFGSPAFRFANPGNPDLISETVKTYEFGAELGFFWNRLNLSATRYNATTVDALFTPGAPPTSGQFNQIQNIGEIENTGWEFALNADLIRNENHNLKVSASYNTNDNLVTSTGGSAPFVVGGFTVIGSWVEEGQSLGYLRGTEAVSNGDGTYTFNPNTPLGKTFAPKFGSFSLNYTFKDFSFFTTGDYQYGGKIVDLSFLLRHLRGVDNTGIPDDLVGTTSPFNYVNYFTFDNDFIKIRNIGASYRFGDLLKPFSDVTLGFTVTNPFNWTAGEFDPEITGSGISAQNGFASGGFAYGTESAPRIFMTSLKFQF
ncbi:TonB-dependent receptor [Gramella sp. MAR_2010_147]|uniref:TonB-dependent receptor domain-containing protein n=1 Tax=Gramella sp. MAR_2010_147 TaxID=1250205 RepID=UPI00087DD58D|nr:TonB-dependent receptor [Gramella sp. MAR_2010_147]SDS52574.1 Outer membrane receptor proteins, mostly Fe transport [Gramella sp. MAR_2010_147]